MNKISIISLFSLLLLSLLLTLSAVAQDRSDRPNILFISIDDLNDWIGAMNTHPQVQTPNMDRLAERGTLFTNAHVQAPLCNPSRVSVMTGLRPTTTGIYNLAPLHHELESTKNVVTIPEYFEEFGYSTYAVGKVFHNASSNKATFQHEGTETRFFGPVPDDKIVDIPLDMVDHPLIDWGVYPVEGDSLIKDYRFASWAVDRLDEIGSEEQDHPFFMAVGFWLPHVPLYTTQQWFDLYPDEKDIVLPSAPELERDDVPDFAWKIHWHLPEPRLSWLLEHNQWHAKVRAYLATISFIDSQVGRVLDALEENGLSDDTIVVLWSDHGYHLGEKGITGKNSLWERSTRVPLIFAGPGVTAGARSSQPAELLDLYPTLIDLTGLPENENLEGLSLMPQLKYADAYRERPAITTHNPGNHSVRSHRWRYIRYADGSEELYDHFRDPHEWSNLAGNSDYSGVIEDHAKWLPKEEAPHAAGSRHRLLEEIDGEWYWEGERIEFENLIR
ncbi:MAG: choline-sulfatase [Balneolaceae bacterium]|nr:MAG: choline-sulfatase [Balneolaceae bacterium]